MPSLHPDQRPLCGSTTGQYNMNFIDPTNDIASYCNGTLPSYLEDLITQHFETMTFSQYQSSSNQKNHFVPVINMCESKLFGSEESEQENSPGVNDHCSVCTEYFRPNQEVKVLPCLHCFHKSCIKPWFEVNSKCPNCRFDLYEGKCVSQ